MAIEGTGTGKMCVGGQDSVISISRSFTTQHTTHQTH